MWRDNRRIHMAELYKPVMGQKWITQWCAHSKESDCGRISTNGEFVKTSCVSPLPLPCLLIASSGYSVYDETHWMQPKHLLPHMHKLLQLSWILALGSPLHTLNAGLPLVKCKCIYQEILCILWFSTIRSLSFLWWLFIEIWLLWVGSILKETVFEDHAFGDYN